MKFQLLYPDRTVEYRLSISAKKLLHLGNGARYIYSYCIFSTVIQNLHILHRTMWYPMVLRDF